MAPTMRVLTGPPGTGKTYLAAEEAVRAVDGTVPSGGRVALIKRHQELVASGAIVWVTFHPSYSYEDFVEGFRPVQTGAGMAYEVRPGPFLEICRRSIEDTARARFRALRPGMKLKSTVTEYTVVAAEQGVVILTSEVVRSDAAAPSKLATAAWLVIEKLITNGIQPEDLSIPGNQAQRRRVAAQRAGLTPTDFTNSGHLRAVLEYLVAPGVDSPRPVALVIDELNRADLSRVFGELITLLEADKREGAAEERTILLPYSQVPFSVPPTVSVIATMNTADRSLAEIDLALRRRFDFANVLPDPSLCPPAYGGTSVAAWLTRRNEALAALGYRDNQLGHADFMETALESRRAAMGLPADDDSQLRVLAATIRAKALPLLIDLFRSDWRQAEAVLGRAGLLEYASPAPAVESAIEEFAAPDEAGAYRMPDWWSPTSDDWDASQFQKAMSA